MGFMSSSFSKALLLNLRRIGLNPSAIPALLSLGVHGLLFAILPVLPYAAFELTEPHDERSVDVVELTDDELSRLPDFSTAQIELPPIFQDSPTNSSNLPLVPLPNQPPNPSTFNSPLFPSSPWSSSITIPSFPPLPPPISTAPPPRSPVAPPPEAEPPVEEETPQTALDEVVPDEENPVAAEDTEPAPIDTEQETIPDSPPPQRSDEEIIAGLMQEQEAMRERIAQLSQDDTGIGDEAVLGNLGEWAEAIGAWFEGNQQKFDQINLKEPTLVAGVYPEIACELQASRFAWVGVLVDAEGRVIDEPGFAPRLIHGSGYRIFNEQAIVDAKAHTFEPTGEKEAYLVQVDYEYPNPTCSSLPSEPPAS